MRARAMMRISATMMVPAVALMAIIPMGADAQIRDREALIAALDSAAQAHVEHPMVAGVSVAVARGEETLLERGYGYVDLEWGIETPPDASARYEIGSITKQFTAAVIMKLVEEGRLDLDADFTEYLTDFDARGHVVPLRRLLDHTSGIKSYTAMSAFGGLSVQDLPRDTLVSLVEAEPFEFEPGTAQIYNNSAFFFLGLIIERISGTSYEEYVHEHLFDELGMDDSYYCSESAIQESRAHGYDGSPEGLQRKSYLDHTWPYAAGSLCSTAGDLIRWNQALHGGDVVSDMSYRAMTTPMPLVDGTPLEYAMGLGVGDRAGTRVISHGGGINGFLSDGRYYPEEDLTIVVLQNSTGPQGPGALGAAFSDLILGSVPDPLAVAYSGDMDSLVGEYIGPARGIHLHMRVTRDGDQLVFTPGDAENGERPLHVGDGVWQSGGTRFSFKVLGGEAVELMMFQGSSRYRLKRNP
jgi:CubicO group peptidase (beta-lactamase class C family)